MKILYALQGTGNGHLTRAQSIIPALQKHGDVDVLISGMQVEITPEFPVAYRLKGLGFIFGNSGGIDLMATYRKAKLRRFKKEIAALPVDDYDLVISDFEPVSAWACLQKGKPCIGLSHQAAVLHPQAPRPKAKDRVGAGFLHYYAPVLRQRGFHFAAYGEGIHTPVIRAAVRRLAPKDEGHYTVYLPAYSDKRITALLLHFPDVRWEVFSKHAEKISETQNVIVRPVHDNLFLQSVASAKGVLCGAGFETPAEALFLKKKLMVVPMKGQYEQQCNAAALSQMGVPVLKSLNEKHIALIDAWLEQEVKVQVEYPDETAAVIDALMHDFEQLKLSSTPESLPYDGKFKKNLLQKMVAAYLNI